MTLSIGDYPSTLLYGLSDFWQRFFRDVGDLEAFYQASEVELGEAYLDLLTTVLNVSVEDTPLFDKEMWRLFAIRESEVEFQAGLAVSEDRFVYDMPGSAVYAGFLQNTIFSPTVVLERDVDFEVQENDGYVRFKEDPFKGHQDEETGEWYPTKGLAWRYVNIETGNKFTDHERGNTAWSVDTDVKRGDTLRLLAYTGSLLSDSGGVSNGQLLYAAPDTFFVTTVPGTFDDTNLGDILKVKNTGSLCDGFYVVKEILSEFQVLLEPSFYEISASSGWLEWELYKGVYFENFNDFPIEYLDKNYLVGSGDTAYPLEHQPTLVYSVVRDRAEDSTTGYPLSGPIPAPSASDTGDPANKLKNVGGDLYVELNGVTPFMPVMGGAVPPWGLSLGAPYNRAFTIVEVAVAPDNEAKLDENPSILGLEVGESVTFDSPWAVTEAPPESDLGVRHVEKGSVEIFANRLFGGLVQENEDYVVDYYRGRIIPTKPWAVTSSNRASFQYKWEVLFAAGGEVFEQQTGKVKEISYWVPEVSVDNFSLYYNYGTLLNRFEASSNAYKAFLRGIMHFYVSGPILKRTEAALNVIADLLLIRTEGEILQDYDNGINGEGNDGTLVAASSTFNTPSYTFSELDVGGYVMIEDATKEANEGSFRILEVVDANTVELETIYGFVNETPLDWKVSRSYLQRVVTDKQTYSYPLLVPLREDVKDSDNYGKLEFSAFESLTTAFTVVDYLEDATWWHNKYIPEILWQGQPAMRRLASTTLFENVILPADDAQIGDPGLYIGADDEGNIGAADSDYRHNVAFALFDRYLKMHMFNVDVDSSLELDSEFRQDLDELILVAKPSYTYPYVSPGQAFEDAAELWDTFLGTSLNVELADNIEIANNDLLIGSYLSLGDYYRYVVYPSTPTGVVSPPPPGPSLPLPIAPNEHIVRVNLSATVDGGTPVVEGVHYTFDYDPTSPTAWTFTPDVATYAWDPGPISFMALVVAIDNQLPPPDPDTRLGYTPLFIGGLEPLYVRKGLPGSPVIPEEIDRAIEITIDDGGSSYTYP